MTKRIGSKAYGLVLTAFLSALLVYIFCGEAVRNPNTTFFSASGDGLKDYFTTTYLVKYDTSYWHSNAMNYPYGENVMFTGSQPTISLLVKLISCNLFDISDYTVAILNLTMLLSLIHGSMFLYLLLKHFNLPTLYSVAVALGITFLSPQIARMGGHFSLSYVFAIPLILYLTAKFHQRPRVSISIALGVFMLWAVGTHVYMLGFYSFIVLIYWITNIFYLKTVSIKNGALHFAIQFIIPFAVLLTIVAATNNVTDRTSEPWGFLVFVTRPESFLLPLGRPYAKFLYHLSDFRHIEWESIAFVGLVASVGFLALLFITIQKLFRKQFVEMLWPKQNPDILNVFLWVSAISLFYSFGFPFKLGLPWLVDYIGPLKQMRGLARFSWIFFYVINIYVFIKIWHKIQLQQNRFLKPAILLIPLAVLHYDAWYNTQFWTKFLNNKIPTLSKNCEWEEAIKTEDYQAILPIPFFHIGSENIWVDSQAGMSETSFELSWKTGLPCMGVMMSRTSISQTFGSLELVWEPYRVPKILEKLKINKDILIVAKENGTQIAEHQQALIQKSELKYKSKEFSLYRLPFDSLTSTFRNIYHKQLSQLQRETVYSHGLYQSTSSTKDFHIDLLSDSETEPSPYEGGTKLQKFSPKRMFYQCATPCANSDTEYTLSFWIKGISTDLLPRAQLIVELQDNTGKNYHYNVSSLSKSIVATDCDWALIETTFKAKAQGDTLGFWLYSYSLRKQNYTIANIMVRPSTTNIYKTDGRWLMKNNRYYPKI